MPSYKFVNADQLDADLTAVADSIRAKGKTTGALAFPAGFQKAVSNISTGIDVQKESGTFTTNNSGEATFVCGFKPDLIVFTSNFLHEFSVSFHNKSVGAVIYPLVWANEEGKFAECSVTLTDTGATLSGLVMYKADWGETVQKNKVLNYTAIKFT